MNLNLKFKSQFRGASVKIRNILPDIFAIVFDLHYIATYATFADDCTLGYKSVLRRRLPSNAKKSSRLSAIAPVRTTDNCDRNSSNGRTDLRADADELRAERNLRRRRRREVAKLARAKSSIWTAVAGAPTNEGGRYRYRL